MQHRVKVSLFFRADPVTADFAVRNGLKVHRIDQLINRQLDRQIGLITQYEQWDPVQGGLVDQLMQLLRGGG